ncbi:YolD-like family protein [Neobacillus mesonae]|uniref:YolD-like family protein n=1 Tax=Neobacillus mesonae TaxID=1193713 RepID=UPI00203D2B5A|nr:YolD-like family protein [Neobacillus mesonae]MCM3569799.1 YolD-like family protein [Neobacillus mesonae]
MFLKKLAMRKPVTVVYDKNGSIQTVKGRVYRLSLREQILSLIDEQQKIFSIQLSSIREAY